MKIVKESQGGHSVAVSKEDLALINQLSRKPLGEDEVYSFGVHLCDNEIDRDHERFSAQTLEQLAQLFVGKCGIFDHNWSAMGQNARIYRTEVVYDKSRVTRAGDMYCYLKGYAYMVRTQANQDLIAEIEGGIKKEVSVGCAVARPVCSVCGAESGTCSHAAGQMYGEQLCFVELQEPVDAYEWSFVAVPAQRNAGVVKRFGEKAAGTALLEKQAALGRKYLKELRREVVRLAMLADDSMDGAVFARAAERLEEPELTELKRVYEAQAARRYPAMPQLRRKAAEPQQGDETVFLV